MPFSPYFGYSRDPFTMMRRLNEDLERGFPPLARSRGYPAVNVWQGQHSAAVTAELPGVEPGDIDIQVKDNVLTLSGERRPPAGAESGAWQLRERAYGRFSRVIQLPFRVDPDRVEARFHDGVLEVELHRPEEDKPRRIEIRAA
jgi:HSP20 family protein